MAQIYGERWEIVESLPEGGQGHTFVVKDLQDASETARYVLKRLKNPKRVARFVKEVEAIQKLSHPNVLKLVAFDLGSNEPFLVTEHCAGGTLRTLFAAGKPAWGDIFRLFISIATALNYAHKSGIVHRDIKPDNIFIRLPKIDPVIGDFGLCYLQDTDERITGTDEAVGPRLFMAPELEDGRVADVSAKADVYSLGKLYYWMLTGGKIFSREKLRDEAWDLKKRIPHPYIPGDNYDMEHLMRLLGSMIAPEPAKRPALDEIILAARHTQSLIVRAVNPVGDSIPQRCTYCGWGLYHLAAKGNHVHNFGLNAVGNPNWRVFVCNMCGHVQMFRLDGIKENNWWNYKP
jgi:serine/threonine protein kinase